MEIDEQVPVLRISALKELTKAADALRASPSLASKITAIDIDDDGDELEDDEGINKFLLAKTVSSACDSLIFILDQICENGQLESFSWTGDTLRCACYMRPQPFWTALSKTAPQLRHLELGFFEHEIHDLKEIDVFPANFMELISLKLHLDGAHGDDATAVDEMLRNLSKLKQLELYLPTCDLDNCWMKGLSYEYEFSELTDLSISVHDSAGSGLQEFLTRHVKVAKLSLDLQRDSDTPVRLKSGDFLHLRALHMKPDWGQGEIFSDLLSASNPRLIAYLNAMSCPKQFHSDIVNISKSIRYLELSDSWDSWREDEFPQQLTELLLGLPELEELCLELPTGNLSWLNEDGTRGEPNPMNFKDLTKLFTCIPTQSRIRAVRMADSTQGFPLPPEFLADVPGVPSSLGYLRWDTEGQKSLYRLEKSQGKVRAVACEPLRASAAANLQSWTDESILEHLRYRRPVPYTISEFLAKDYSQFIASAPMLLSIGANPNSVNAFTGLDISYLTGGVINGQTLLDRDHFVCFCEYTERDSPVVGPKRCRLLGVADGPREQAPKHGWSFIAESGSDPGGRVSSMLSSTAMDKTVVFVSNLEGSIQCTQPGDTKRAR